MAALRNVVAEAAERENPSLLYRLSFNQGEVIEPEECRWLAAQRRAADRDAVARDDENSEELVGLIDELAAFCEWSETRWILQFWQPGGANARVPASTKTTRFASRPDPCPGGG